MQISILGCGWLGFSLAKHLITLHYKVKGSTTTKNKIDVLKLHSIEPYLLDFNPALSLNSTDNAFWDSEVLVLNIPPGRSQDDVVSYHTKQIQSVKNIIADSSIKFVVFISSTSVYPKHPGRVTEPDTVPEKAGRASGNALIKAEKILLESTNFETTVLRFGGLYGGDRHPAKYMTGRKNISNPDAPVNLIHRDDCIQIITKIIENNIIGEIFNAVCDGHPTRNDYYTAAAKTLGLEPPTFKKETEPQNYKFVSNEKLKQRLSYSFIHPQPLVSLQN